jgi:hypothetical protein
MKKKMKASAAVLAALTPLAATVAPAFVASASATAGVIDGNLVRWFLPELTTAEADSFASQLIAAGYTYDQAISLLTDLHNSDPTEGDVTDATGSGVEVAPDSLPMPSTRASTGGQRYKCYVKHPRHAMHGGASGKEIASQTMFLGWCVNSSGQVTYVGGDVESYGVSTYGQLQGWDWDDPPHMTDDGTISNGKGKVRMQGHLEACYSILIGEYCWGASIATMSVTVGPWGDYTPTKSPS